LVGRLFKCYFYRIYTNGSDKLEKVREAIRDCFKTTEARGVDRTTRNGCGYHFYMCSGRLMRDEFRNLKLRDYRQAFYDVIEGK